MCIGEVHLNTLSPLSRNLSTQVVFENIRDARAKLVAEREAIIARRLDKRLSKIREKYNRRHRQQMGKLP